MERDRGHHLGHLETKKKEEVNTGGKTESLILSVVVVVGGPKGARECEKDSRRRGSNGGISDLSLELLDVGNIEDAIEDEAALALILGNLPREEAREGLLLGSIIHENVVKSKLLREILAKSLSVNSGRA